VQIRNPYSIRPWQHINDVVFGYLLMGLKSEELSLIKCNSLNFGPNNSKYTVWDLIEVIQDFHPSLKVEIVKGEFKETKTLILDSSMAKELLDWDSKKSVLDNVSDTCKLVNLQLEDKFDEIRSIVLRSIHEYL
jgi:CDP-glucose 4,6-dehydratase